MYLKTLTVRGFKSFASSTTLRFEPGITCVVGPNGSGKSNVVDALAWVMGEQGAKSLRGGKMEDVIFAGTASRAPLGRAEVVLTIDNTDGALPIEYSEVTISRLMFRSGQSEYAINGDSCRLLDVQDLLSDSGIGREMHVIIGQGQLDAVLHSGPEGRRAVIEEAAGVLKHRKRKEKALRKLDAMQANLTRVEDLTTELRRQLKPLGKQAEIARKAATIQSELRDARIRLLADDLVSLKTTLDRDAADEATVRERRTDVERELAVAQTREAELEAESQAQAPRLASAQDTLFSLSSLRERLRGTAELAAERHRNAGEARDDERRGRDPEDMEREAAVVREQEETLRERLEMTREELDEAVRERSATEAALKGEERRLADAARAAADRREGLAKLSGHVEALRSKIQATDAEIGRLTEALRQAEERAVAAQAERDGHGAEVAEDPELVAEHQRARDGLELAKATAEEARTSVDAPKQAVRQAGAAVAAARTADQQAQREIAALQARIEALELGLRRSADGAETLLGADLEGVLGTIAELVSVEPGAEVAVAAALGAAAGAVAVSSLETAADAFGLLRSKDAGRAGLVVGGDPSPAPGARSSAGRLGSGAGGAESGGSSVGDWSAASVVPGARSGSSAGAGGSDAGISRSLVGRDAGTVLVAGARWAVDLVRVPESLESAVGFLLDGVVVVRDLDEGCGIVAAQPALRVVTWEGDLLGAHWAEGGGAAGGQSLLEMRGTLDEAVRRLAEVRAEAAGAADSLAFAADAEAAAQAAVEASQAAANDAQRGVGEAQSVLDRVRSRVREADAVAAAQANRLAQFDAAARAMRDESTRLAAAVTAAELVREEDLSGLAGLEERLRQAEDAPLDDDDADTSRRDEVAERCQELRSVEMEARLSVRTAEERVKAISGRADALEQAAVTERADRARAAERRERRAREAKVAYAVMVGAQRAVLAIERSLAAALTEREAAERDRDLRDEGLKTVRVRVRELSGELEKLVNAVHGTEVARAEQRLRMEQLEERALEEFGLEIAGLIAEYGPDQLIPLGPDAAADAVPEAYVREVQEKRARHAEKQLQTLGRVNPLALEEFAALEERHAFLTSQLEDLKKTRRDLLTVVKEVDERVEQVFAAAYEDTAREFEDIFGRLFPGGDGRLMLTEPEDMLTTGVEVEARPPGKKVKRLSLLSGGERSLVAIALLVAIFKARPSPFYVLDEVEAALDDTNTQRLLSILEELRESSQLIIITHQKRTMEGADALYGVSMQGDGVTQVISQRLREPEPA